MHESLKPYLDLVEQGYLNSKESGSLILFNYTDQTTYDKHWNEYTSASRGLIFNKETGEIVARPFSKFFNLNEHETTFFKNLPKEPYSVFEKVDGSLGILYCDPFMTTWKIATRGSFDSVQAKKAQDMFYQKSINQWLQNPQWHQFTLLFEIIYPENRVQPGARLVVDYGSVETLVLLGAIHKTTGMEPPYSVLLEMGQELDIPVAKAYDYRIEEVIELQKTLPMTAEGFVIKYKSGLRVKCKGQEYCKMQRILNNINPLAIWEAMAENPEGFQLPLEYLLAIPEEILPEVESIVAKLNTKYEQAYNKVIRDYNTFLSQIRNKYEPGSLDPKAELKELGLYTQNPANGVYHPGAMFPFHKGEVDKVRHLLVKCIKPKANILE